jgi:hypothetical protein
MNKNVTQIDGIKEQKCYGIREQIGFGYFLANLKSYKPCKIDDHFKSFRIG